MPVELNSELRRFGITSEASQSARLLSEAIRSSTYPRAVMAAPPVVTYGADFAGTSLSGAVYIPINDSRIISSCVISVAYNTQGRDVFKDMSGAASSFCFSFSTDAPVFEIDVQSQPYWPFNMIVDGELISASRIQDPTAAGGNIRRLVKVDFGSRKIRNITVSSSVVSGGTAGIYVTNKDQVFPYSPNVCGQFLDISDSYGGYTTGGMATGGPASAIYSAIQSAVIAQYGGSGYNVTNGGTTYLQRLQAFVSAGNSPKIIKVSGGINDAANAATQTAINDFYSWVSINLPDCLLLVTGPWCPNQSLITGTDKYTQINGWIKSALQASGVRYVFMDTLSGSMDSSFKDSILSTSPWITGSGKEGATTGTGNADLYISSDGTHPSVAGLDYLSRRVAYSVANMLGAKIK